MSMGSGGLFGSGSSFGGMGPSGSYGAFPGCGCSGILMILAGIIMVCAGGARMFNF